MSSSSFQVAPASKKTTPCTGWTIGNWPSRVSICIQRPPGYATTLEVRSVSTGRPRVSLTTVVV